MKMLYLIFMNSLVFGCQDSPEPKKARDQAAIVAPTQGSSLESDSSEGVVGPDDVYFSGVYLESLFKASQANPNLTLAEVPLSLKVSGQVDAFDFAANLQPKRLALMSRILLKLGDKDSDRKLSFGEFTSIKLIPELHSAKGSDRFYPHALNEELFDKVSGADGLLAADEIEACLAQLSAVSDLAKMTRAEIRQALSQGWQRVVSAYDLDKDGKASFDEQRTLRKERAILLSRFAD